MVPTRDMQDLVMENHNRITATLDIGGWNCFSFPTRAHIACTAAKSARFHDMSRAMYNECPHSLSIIKVIENTAKLQYFSRCGDSSIGGFSWLIDMGELCDVNNLSIRSSSSRLSRCWALSHCLWVMRRLVLWGKSSDNHVSFNFQREKETYRIFEKALSENSLSRRGEYVNDVSSGVLEVR